MNNNENRSKEELDLTEDAETSETDAVAADDCGGSVDDEDITLLDEYVLTSDKSAEAEADDDKIEAPAKERPKKRSWKDRTVKERLVTLIPTFIMFVILVITEWQMEIGDVYTDDFNYSMLLIGASVVIGIFCIRLGKVWGWIVTALAPAASFFLTEMFTHNPIEQITGRLIALNIILYYLLAIFVLFLTGSMKASVLAVTVPPMLYGLTNYYVLEFRGTPFFPWDIASAGIAADVVDNYEFIISWHVCFIVLAFIFIMQLGCLCTPRIRLKLWWLRAPLAIISAAAIIMSSTYIQSDEGVKELKMYPYLFTPKSVYNKNGVGVTFIYTLQFAGIEKPGGYSPENLESMLSEYESEPVDENADYPNVIVIMNEAFSDLRTAADYKQKIPVTPYIDSLSDDTVKGTLHVSVKGGNTPNSEFEFLTGISMANLTPGCIPYQQHIKGVTPTFVSQMNELGYKTVGMHPYGATGWNRDQVYEWFGFDETYFSSDFKGAEKIRNYYSDAATYQKIIELYESKGEDEPLFVFDVTMQNHGGYSTQHENFTAQTHVAGLPAKGSVNTYLSLINKSDEAFGELVDYFKAQDEDTVILMFGDHQPHDSYVKSLLDLYQVEIETGSMDEQLRRYTVPFVMWANYDIEEGADLDISLNYLSSLLCEKAGVPRTATQMYLSALAEKYPVVTEGHFSDSEGVYHSAAEMDSISDFNDYEKLSYNMIADAENMIEGLYSYK